MLIADGTGGLRDLRLTVLLREAFRHTQRALGAGDDGMQVLLNAGIDTTAPGILVGEKTTTAASARSAELLGTLTLHRASGTALRSQRPEPADLTRSVAPADRRLRRRTPWCGR